MPWIELPKLPDNDVQEFGRQFKRKARFLIDESAGEGLARALRDVGWNAIFVSEVGLVSHADEEVFALAWREDRVILTHDRDFLDDRRFPYHRNPGIVVLPGASGQGTGMIEAVRDVLSIIGRFRDAYRGEKIEISEDQTWTVKGFDKQLGRHYKNRFRFGKHGVVWHWDDEIKAEDDG